MQNVHQMQTKLMKILHGECSSEGDMCNSTDAIASKKKEQLQHKGPSEQTNVQAMLLSDFRELICVVDLKGKFQHTRELIL